MDSCKFELSESLGIDHDNISIIIISMQDTNFMDYINGLNHT